MTARSDDVELFTLDQIETAYEAWRAGDVPQSFPAMMRDSGWFIVGKQSRADNCAAALPPAEEVEEADKLTDAIWGKLNTIDTAREEGDWIATYKELRRAVRASLSGSAGE